MQLVAYGAQDIYLTGNPQITFFKVVYRRHTNFSMESIEQTWNGTEVGVGGGRCTATISRNGDLVHRMYLEMEGTLAAVSNPGHAAIVDVELEIGGQKIDKHSGTWMEVWAELTEPNPSGHVGNSGGATQTGTLFQNMAGAGGSLGTTGAEKLWVPLQFWFCRNPGLALPLIALQYHEVKVILNQSLCTDATTGPFHSTTTPVSQKLWCDYIYLDTDERRRFAQVSHEYLIEQVQEQSWSATSTDLNFNHPVKELIWTQKPALQRSCLLRVPSSGKNTFQLKLNGHDRFAARDWRYFTRTQIWQHHSGAGGLVPNSNSDGAFGDFIAVYSFALKPEEHQPSGTCNFSRIDNAQLIGAGATANVVFAVNYNVLRIMSGMGGLAYSN